MNALTHHHPSEELLVDFSAGTLQEAPALCVSVHLHYCERCRSRVAQLNDIGAELLCSLPSTEVDSKLLDSIFDQIDRGRDQDFTAAAEPSPANQSSQAASNKSSAFKDFPPIVQKLIDSSFKGLPRWKRLSSSIDVSRLVLGQSQYEVALHRICAGGKSLRHNHAGSEFTVVLKGSFSDEDGVYTPGDFVYKKSGESHQPMGTQMGECICLSALEAPIRLPGLLGYVMRPFLRIRPA